MKNLLTFIFVLLMSTAFSQDEKSPYQKFGSVTIQDLQKELYAIDSNANAVVLFSSGNTEIEGSRNGGFSVKTIVHKVIHILNENGYDEADVRIPLYKSGITEENVSNFRGFTYNIVGEKMEKVKVKPSVMTTENIDENHLLQKFTMPGVKKGTIIEYSYQMNSEFIGQPDPWYFQSTTSPTLWSEYSFAMPEFFFYQVFSIGFLPIQTIDPVTNSVIFHLVDGKTTRNSQSAVFQAAVTFRRWIVRNAPELKTEPYTRSVRNHIARLEFQLASQRYPLPIKNLRNTWQDVAKTMLESESFGKNLNTNNGWMKDDLKKIAGDEQDSLKKAELIYKYVRDGFKTTDNYGVFMKDNLKKVYSRKSGNVAELNVLLTAMLRQAGFEASPVLLSTTSHGYAFEYAPLIASMNYVVVKLKANGQDYFLDASQPRLSFGKLPVYCYNGFAAIMDDSGTSLTLSSDSLQENSKTAIFFVNTEDGYAGSVKKTEGYYSSVNIRDEYSGNNEEAFFTKVREHLGEGIAASDFKVSALENLDRPVEVEYKLKLNAADEDLLYINPYFGENYTKNPFASANRYYPVEFPYQIRETVLATLDLPEGYEIDELPGQVRVNLDETGNSFFEYRIEKSGPRISFISRLMIGRTVFMPDEYDTLREFFNYVVKKQSEVIVLKRI